MARIGAHGRAAWWSLVLALLALASMLLGPAPASATTSVLATGRVHNATDQGLAGITVTVLGATYGNVLGTAVSDASGNFAVTGTSAPTVKVSFEDPGGVYQRRFNGSAATFAAAPAITLPSGGSVQINQLLPLRPAITGTVHDRYGIPLPGIEVTPFSAYYGAPYPSTTTDAAGAYTTVALPEGDVKLRFHDPSGNFATMWTPAHPTFSGAGTFHLTAGPATLQDETLYRAGALRGAVTDAAGRPIAGIVVVASPSSQAVIGPSATTEADGTYRIGDLLKTDPPYGYRVLALDPASVADPGTGYLPTFAGDLVTSSATLSATFADAPTQPVTEGAELGLATIHLTPVHCDPVTFHAGATLGGATLDGALLRGCFLPFADLTGAHLAGADAGSAGLAGVRAAGADLTGADLSSALLANADLTGADLTSADLTGADLTAARLDGATVAGTVWSDTTCPDGTNSDAGGGTCLGHGVAGSALVVDRTDDAVDDAPGDGTCHAPGGGCTLRAAVQEANARPGPDTITLTAATHTLGLTGAREDAAATGDLDVTDDLTLDGGGAALVAWGLGDRLIDVRSGATVSITDLTLAGGTAPDGTAGTSTAVDGVAPTPGGDGEDGGDVRNDGTLTLRRVAVTDGRSGIGGTGGSSTNATDGGAVGGAGGAGGGIASTGPLTLDGVTIVQNATGRGGVGGNAKASGKSGGAGRDGGDGGGLAALGPATVTLTGAPTVVASNGAGGAGWSGTNGYNAPLNPPARGGDGGGVAIDAGAGLTADAAALTVVANRTEPVPSGSFPRVVGDGGGLFVAGTFHAVGALVSANRTGWVDGAGETSGRGGGIASTGTTTLIASSVAANLTGAGESGNGWGSGSTGAGGGIWSTGDLSIVTTTVAANATGDGGGTSLGGDAGDGGGIASSGTLLVDRSTVNANRAGSGGDGQSGISSIFATHGTDGGNGGRGGGIASSGSATIHNSTVTGNRAGDGGAGGDGGNVTGGFGFPSAGGNGGDAGDGGAGGGIAVTAGSATLTFVTITKNEVGTAGTAGFPGSSTYGLWGQPGAPGAAPTSGGLDAGSGTATVAASVVAIQTKGKDCEGAVVSAGSNLSSTTSCGFTATGDLPSTLPGLYPLGSYGGLTQTQPPTPTSAARNKIAVGSFGCGTSVTVDQRDTARPKAGACDIGAAEA